MRSDKAGPACNNDFHNEFPAKTIGGPLALLPL
jgi:hypothetical protein